MSLWKIAYRSIQQRMLASTLTAISMALGVALVVAVLVIYSVVDASFRRNAQGFNLIVGAKGSPLDLVFNTVYHMGNPIRTIPYKCYEDLDRGKYSSEVEAAIPVCIGDNYKGFRIIGTIPEMFEKLEYLGGRKYQFAQGENFRKENVHDAVVGAVAARKTGLRVGDTFRPVHGVEAEHGREHEPFKVVGILAATGTPNDRALFVNMEGFYTMHKGEEEADEEEDAEANAKPAAAHDKQTTKHEKEKPGSSGHKETAHEEHGATHDKAEKPGQEPKEAGHDGHDHAGHDQEKKVTAVLVVLDESRIDRAQALFGLLNDEPYTQAVRPAEVIDRLFKELIGNIEVVLLILAVLIVIVAGIGILVSIYNSMNDRRHEIAIMRALGARRQTVMMIILLESILLSLGGGALGLTLGHGLVAAMTPLIVEQTGVAMSLLYFQPAELILIPGLIVLASLVGYLPAVMAYRTDVARSLVANP